MSSIMALLDKYRIPIYDRCMKPISLHVSEDDYATLKSLATGRGRPVAELIREAMAEYVVRESRHRPSLLSLPAHASGELLAGWSRSELADEMLDR